MHLISFLALFISGQIIAIIAIILIIGSALLYIVKAKKSGRKCIGCPDGCTCKVKKMQKNLKKAKGYCSCCSNNEKENK